MDRDVAIAILKDVERHPIEEDQKRAKASLLELSNDVVNPKPVAVSATLAFEEPNRCVLAITCFDEDRNLLGIRLRGQCQSEDGRLVALEEEYAVFPGFADQLKSSTVERRLIPVCIHEGGDRKDEVAWLQYENRISNMLIQEVIAGGKQNTLRTLPQRRPGVDMPPIYVSVPDPNGVSVQISVYDRAGQVSEWIAVRLGASLSLYRPRIRN